MPVNSPVFTSGGISSGLDTNSIVDAMVSAEQQPMNALKALQSAHQTQISTLGDLSSKLDALSQAAKALGTNGVVGNVVQSSASGYSASPGASAVPGAYSVQVDALAQAAKARSQSFTDAFQPVTGGTLSLSVQGTNYDITINDGDPLQSVADAINRSGAPVAAAVLTSTTGAYLSLTARDTGFPVGGQPSDALTITETSTGSQGQPLSASILTPAANAQIQVDGLTFQSSTNNIANAVPGTVITAQRLTTSPETLTIGADEDATQKKLQTFVDAYNAVMSVVNKQLQVTQTTDRESTLAGDPTVRALQQRLHDLITTVVNPNSGVRSLADIGLKSDDHTGALSIDSDSLQRSLANDTGAVNLLFQQSATGLAAVTKSLVDDYTDPLDGVFVAKKQGLNKEVSSMSDQLAQMQAHIDAYKKALLAQFTQMETVIGGLKSVGAFLTQQEAQNNKSNG